MAIAKKTKKGASPNRRVATKHTKAPRPEGADGDNSGDGDDGDGNGRSTPLGLEVDADVLEFIEALDRFKKSNNRPFPSWSEVLFVLKDLGYRRT